MGYKLEDYCNGAIYLLVSHLVELVGFQELIKQQPNIDERFHGLV